MPLNYLLVIILVAAAPSIRVDEATKGVSSEIGTVRIHLTSRVVGLKVHLCLINKTDDLDVVGGLHELNTLERSIGDKASSVAGFGTPRDGLVLGLTNSGGTFRWSPETEIWEETGEKPFRFRNPREGSSHYHSPSIELIMAV